MALANMSVKIGTRVNKRTGAPQSSVAAAAYRSGENIHDAQTETTHRYGNRANSVWDNFILAPDGAPEWASERTELWNQNEQVNKRKDSQLFRDVRVSLQRELPLALQRDLIADFANEHFVSKGMVADIAIHTDAENHNPHAHIMLTMNHLTADGFGKKNRDWNEFIPVKANDENWGTATAVSDMRQDLEDRFNKAFEDEGIDLSICYQSYDKQGLDKQSAHMSREALAMEEKGERTDQGDLAALNKALSASQAASEVFNATLQGSYHANSHTALLQRMGSWMTNVVEQIKDFPRVVREQWSNLTNSKAPAAAQNREANLDRG